MFATLYFITFASCLITSFRVMFYLETRAILGFLSKMNSVGTQLITHPALARYQLFVGEDETKADALVRNAS